MATLAITLIGASVIGGIALAHKADKDSQPKPSAGQVAKANASLSGKDDLDTNDVPSTPRSLAPARPKSPAPWPPPEELPSADPDAKGTEKSKMLPVAGSNAAPIQVGQRMGNINFLILGCHRVTRSTIECSGIAENDANRPTELSLEEGGSSTDNLGNAQIIYRVGGIRFGDSWKWLLEKGTPVNFSLQFTDRSFGTAASTSIRLSVRVDGNYENHTRPFSPIRID